MQVQAAVDRAAVKQGTIVCGLVLITVYGLICYHLFSLTLSSLNRSSSLSLSLCFVSDTDSDSVGGDNKGMNQHKSFRHRASQLSLSSAWNESMILAQLLKEEIVVGKSDPLRTGAKQAYDDSVQDLSVILGTFNIQLWGPAPATPGNNTHVIIRFVKVVPIPAFLNYLLCLALG